MKDEYDILRKLAELKKERGAIRRKRTLLTKKDDCDVFGFDIQSGILVEITLTTQIGLLEWVLKGEE